MRLGAVFPTTEIGNDPIAVRDYAQAAETLGCVRLTAYDHVLGADHADREPPLRGPYTQHDPFHEPFVLFGFLAAHTSRIELATGVLVLPQRQTALVAKQAAEIDLLSGGRLVLGVGTGWNHVEYTALGTTFARSRSPLRRPGRRAASVVATGAGDAREPVPPHRACRPRAAARPFDPAVDGWLGRGIAGASGAGRRWAHLRRQQRPALRRRRAPRRAARRSGSRPRHVRHGHVRRLRRRPRCLARTGRAVGSVRRVVAVDALDDDRHVVPRRGGGRSDRSAAAHRRAGAVRQGDVAAS